MVDMNRYIVWRLFKCYKKGCTRLTWNGWYQYILWRLLKCYKKDALDSQPQVIKFTSCLP